MLQLVYQLQASNKQPYKTDLEHLPREAITKAIPEYKSNIVLNTKQAPIDEAEQQRQGQH